MIESQRTSPWLKIFSIGCGAVVLLVFVGAGLVAWNWPSLMGLYHRARTTFGDLMQVQSTLQTKYGGTVAQATLSTGETYDHYEIVFSRERSSGISTTWSFQFKRSDLPPRTEKP